MKANMPGYKSVSFSELDTFIINDVKEYKDIIDSIAYYKEQIKIEENFEIVKKYMFARSDLQHIKNDMEKHYEAHRYIIKHNFKVKVDGTYHPFEREFMIDSLFRVD